MCSDDYVDGDEDAENDDDDDDDGDDEQAVVNIHKEEFARCLLHSNRLSCSPYMDSGDGQYPSHKN